VSEIDTFLELVQGRRSIRRFKTDPVPQECIEKVLESARWAMSGANAQPWEFVVVKDSALRKQLEDSWFEPHKEMYAIEQTRLPQLRLPPLRRFATQPSYKGAPVLIVVLGDRRTLQASVLGGRFLCGSEGPEATYLKNMANATQNMHLAAAALGLGAKWISVTAVWADAIKDILDIPRILEVHTIVALGYPAYESVAGYRRPLQDIVHFDRYDRSKYRPGEEVYKFVEGLRGKTETAYTQGFIT
jgi:5,6-dimethylbenzimidazole synthase